jgi:hypothetical protein
MFDGVFAWADVPGHASYILIAISYYLTNMLWLRIIAVCGLLLEIVYFQMSGGNMATGIGWGMIFILINLYQIYWLERERRKLNQVEDAHLLRKGVFAGITDLQLARLVTVGKWHDFSPGEVLTRKDEPVTHLVLVCTGKANVDVDGHIVAHLHDGAFVGEMAFVTGNPASATVTVDAPTRAFVFDIPALRKLATNDELVAGAIHRVIGRDMAGKIQVRNDVTSS